MINAASIMSMCNESNLVKGLDIILEGYDMAKAAAIVSIVSQYLLKCKIIGKHGRLLDHASMLYGYMTLSHVVYYIRHKPVLRNAVDENCQFLLNEMARMAHEIPSYRLKVCRNAIAQYRECLDRQDNCELPKPTPNLKEQSTDDAHVITPNNHKHHPYVLTPQSPVPVESRRSARMYNTRSTRQSPPLRRSLRVLNRGAHAHV